MKLNPLEILYVLHLFQKNLRIFDEKNKTWPFWYDLGKEQKRVFLQLSDKRQTLRFLRNLSTHDTPHPLLYITLLKNVRNFSLRVQWIKLNLEYRICVYFWPFIILYTWYSMCWSYNTGRYCKSLRPPTPPHICCSHPFYPSWFSPLLLGP